MNENSLYDARKSVDSPVSKLAESIGMKVPKYRRHKKNYARVVLNGREIHLGVYGSPESKVMYEREIAQWLQVGRKTPKPKRQKLTLEVGRVSIVEMAVHYLEFAIGYYRRPDGTPTGESDNVKDALRPLRRLSGDFAGGRLQTCQSETPS